MFQVVWFKRDLRIEDHAPLAEAARHGPVLPLYIVEPGYWALPDTSARQWDFIAECLADLRVRLTRLGQPLVIRTGDAVSLFNRLHERHGISHLWSHEETGNQWTFDRDKKVAAFCRQHSIRWTEIPQFGVIRRLKDRDLWSRLHDTHMAALQVPPPLHLSPLEGVREGEVPLSSTLGLETDACPGRQKGGRAEALSLLDSFFACRGRNYTFEMSSPLTADKSCSRLSAHLSAGVLSMRETLQRTYQERQRLAAMSWEERPVQLRSIDSFVARLHWHCHFIQKLESEPEIETRAVHPLFEDHRLTTEQNDPRLIAWIEGRTGFPFLDACMRSLVSTGWINFRMRAMLMSFASYHLALDWRVSGMRLARLFTDYEPGIHWPQVQMQSGQTGINTPRMYNPVKQSHDQDADGIFIRRWLPELADLPPAFLHEPWRMSEAEQTMHGVRLGADYPHRIIDHEQAARDARARMSEVRRLVGFRTEAQKVHTRHGSRKRTMTDDKLRRTKAINARKAEKIQDQMTLKI